MRVLQVSLWLLPRGGGIQTYLASLRKALAGTVISVGHAAIEPGTAPTETMTPVRLGRPGWPRWLNALVLWAWLLRRMPQMDVVHIHGALGWPLLIGGLACVICRRPFVVSAHGALYPWYLQRQPWKFHVLLWVVGRGLLRRATAVVANTPAEAAVIAEFDSVVKIRVVTPGIELPPMRAVAARPVAAGVHIAFVGRLEPMKGLPDLLRAIAALQQKQYIVRLDVIGAGVGRHLDELRELSRSLNVDHATTFHGYVTDTRRLELLRRADIVVMPSYAEAFSFSTAEALALGIPVIVTTAVALADTVRRHECGAVVPVADPEAMATAIAKVVDGELREMLMRRARACAEQEFTLAAMARSLLELYRDAVSQKQSG
jgi:glycosyltransferase involved in cell wall biosynthesis